MLLEKKVIQPLLPFIGSFLIIFGYIKLSLYYNKFDIDINNYLELTEILTLFLNDIIFFIISILGVALFSFITTSKIELERDNDVKGKLVKSNNFWERRKQNYILFKELHWISGLLIILYIIGYIWFRDKFWDFFATTSPLIAFTIFVSLLMEFRYKYYNVYGKELNSTINNLVFILLIFSVHTYGTIKSDTKRIENNPRTEISFKYLGEEIKSDKQLRFLGQTKNYMFLYNKSLKETEVFERSKVDFFRIVKLE
jgi:hypothetical protein